MTEQEQMDKWFDRMCAEGDPSVYCCGMVILADRCPSCRREMPDLREAKPWLNEKLEGSQDA